MKYEIMFYGGIVASMIAIILTILTFIKCNVREAVQDLLRIDSKSLKKNKSSKTNNKKDKNKDKKKIESKKKKNKKNIIDEGTTLLEEESTTLLEDDSTTLLDDEGTSLLDEEGTCFLDEEETSLLENDNGGFADTFIKEVDIIFISAKKCI